MYRTQSVINWWLKRPWLPNTPVLTRKGPYLLIYRYVVKDNTLTNCLLKNLNFFWYKTRTPNVLKNQTQQAFQTKKQTNKSNFSVKSENLLKKSQKWNPLQCWLHRLCWPQYLLPCWPTTINNRWRSNTCGTMATVMDMDTATVKATVTDTNKSVTRSRTIIRIIIMVTKSYF